MRKKLSMCTKKESLLDLSSLDLTAVSLTILNRSISCTYLNLYLIQYVPCEDGVLQSEKGVTDLHVDCGI